MSHRSWAPLQGGHRHCRHQDSPDLLDRKGDRYHLCHRDSHLQYHHPGSQRQRHHLGYRNLADRRGDRYLHYH
ncbi:hypothetical protein N0Y54_01810 [Nostoc punctiforme UO1]